MTETRTILYCIVFSFIASSKLAEGIYLHISAYGANVSTAVGL